MQVRHFSAGVLVAAAGAACASSGEPEGPPPYELVYSQDFTAESALDDFVFSDADAWRWWRADGPGALELTGSGDYSPVYRSPHSIALVRDLLVGDFVLEVELQQTGREYGHRDLCLFFGFESPNRFYYAHLATAPDLNSHNVFLVHDAPRRSLAEPGEEGVSWGTGQWHSVRLERNLRERTVRVWFNDMETPVLTATDNTLGWGRIGVGSFDDSGRFARVRVWAPEARKVPQSDSPFR